jgi:tetratricopeptide (TPR) repeat protein
LSFSVFSQEEKRLALVIGNSNYEKGELKNPVNDARLIASTLDSLDFDVILATNLQDQRSFLNTIREFGNKRIQYDVGFVYYAGHGVQIDGENYLLPTKEIYESKNDIEDYAVNVSKIMKYLTAVTDQVNILILDACRDNPFESNWNATRSLKGQGLAKMPPPTGSLIAFSTDAGNTAADGDGENSIYCKSLVKNMVLENTTLDQVFRNVRTDVLKESKNIQRPIEQSQLTGQAFYLVKSDYKNIFSSIEKILGTFNSPYFDETDYTPKLYESLEKLNIIISKDPINAKAFLLSSKIYQQLEQTNKALSFVNKAIEIDDNFINAYFYRAFLHGELGNFELRTNDRNTIIKLDPENITNYMDKVYDFYTNDKYEEGIDVINNLLLTLTDDDDVAEIYRMKGNMHMFLIQEELALDAYSKAIEIDPKNGFLYMQKGDYLARELERHEEALELYTKANSLKPDEPSPYYAIIYSSFALNKLDKITELCEQLMSLDFNDPEPYYHLSRYFNLKNDYLKSMTYLSLAIFKMNEGGYSIDEEQGLGVYLFNLYLKRAKLYKKLNINILECQDLNNALKEISKFQDLSQENLRTLDVYVAEGYINKKINEIEKLILENCK